MISFHYQNSMASAIGPEHGLSEKELADAIAAAAELCRRYDEDCRRGALGFATLPQQDQEAEAVLRYASERRSKFRRFVQVGIGGSALGATAIATALAHRFHNEEVLAGRRPGPAFYVLDNVDPEETRALLELADPKETLYHVVTKSGDTTETMAGFLALVDELKKAVGGKWKDHVVVSTDPEKGFLRKLAREEGLASFAIPPAVGGRFSVLTPVGLLPAAMLGVAPGDLLAGAREADALSRRADPSANPALLFALIAHLLDTRHGKRIHIMMPYTRALRDVADWFRQLWAESLGKNPQVGPTPVVALGTTDQHSQFQLYNEGPKDKYVVFLEVERHRQDRAIPSVFPPDAPCSFLQGKTFSKVMSAMKAGTEGALTACGRPNATLRIPEVSARSVGALFYLLEAATVYAGWLYSVNAFDQPGVEAGKKIAFALLGKPGYSTPPAPPRDPRYIAK